ncbi:MAG: transglutaminase family protein [Candidatus Solibacter sp.]|nr:transglutaminase family protein [Candidatus Solibacter sp.]
MRIAVVHTTRYRYSSPVYLEPHIIRLRPREDASQRLAQWTLDIAPTPLGRTECLDQDGNTVVRAWFDSVTAELALRSQFTLETLRDNPFNYLLTPPDAKLPMQYAVPLCAPLVPYLRDDHSPAVRNFAQSLADECGWQTLPFLAALNQRLFATTRYVIREAGAPHAAETTLRDHEGSCRDLAVLFCSACRALGLAARFVSGYERDASLQENGDLHAWAEVYLEGAGWTGYDPSRALAVAASHVAVAAASDPLLAAPVSGTYRGAASAKMEFSISMQVA